MPFCSRNLECQLFFSMRQSKSCFAAQQEQVERPLRRDLEQFRQLYEARRPHYATARLRIETAGKDIETIAAEITTSLGLSKAGSQGAAK